MSDDSQVSIPELTVLDFMAASGESTTSLKKNMRKYANRRLLAMSARWSRLVEEAYRLSEESRMEELDDELSDLGGDSLCTPRSLSDDVGILAASLSSECAKLEVEAICILSSSSSSSSPTSTRASLDKSEVGVDDLCICEGDDDLTIEMASLARSLQSELSLEVTEVEMALNVA